MPAEFSLLTEYFSEQGVLKVLCDKGERVPAVTHHQTDPFKVTVMRSDPDRPFIGSLVESFLIFNIDLDKLRIILLVQTRRPEQLTHAPGEELVAFLDKLIGI